MIIFPVHHPQHWILIVSALINIIYVWDTLITQVVDVNDKIIYEVDSYHNSWAHLINFFSK